MNTKAGIVVLASDNMYLYENLEKHVLIAATWHAPSNVRAQDGMKQLAAKPKFIIPGHDPAVLTNVPNPAVVSAGLADADASVASLAYGSTAT